ncbi:hypothetical protein AB0F81_03645 [Actinoplanes sp. NPDC024001]|uniref:hypothetical protein n=1 Tax=Actinoplanes sp. NPDC024001 TaxID=3154598 RepID=UPI0033F7A0C8
MRIKVMADYGCWPLWVWDPDERIFDTREPAELGLSASLVGRLEAWQQWHESMINIADPYDSRVVTEAEEKAFAEEGRLLAGRVSAELPDAVVWFHRDQPDAASSS